MKTKTTRRAKTALIEKDSVRGAYDMLQSRMLITHPTYGTVLLLEGFGGSSVEGQCYRWRHGIACAVPAGSTLAGLDREAARCPYPCSIHELGEIVDWDGCVIQRIARSHA